MVPQIELYATRDPIFQELAPGQKPNKKTLSVHTQLRSRTDDSTRTINDGMGGKKNRGRPSQTQSHSLIVSSTVSPQPSRPSSTHLKNKHAKFLTNSKPKSGHGQTTVHLLHAAISVNLALRRGHGCELHHCISSADLLVRCPARIDCDDEEDDATLCELLVRFEKVTKDQLQSSLSKTPAAFQREREKQKPCCTHDNENPEGRKKQHMRGATNLRRVHGKHLADIFTLFFLQLISSVFLPLCGDHKGSESLVPMSGSANVRHEHTRKVEKKKKTASNGLQSCNEMNRVATVVERRLTCGQSGLALHTRQDKITDKHCTKKARTLLT